MAIFFAPWDAVNGHLSTGLMLCKISTVKKWNFMRSSSRFYLLVFAYFRNSIKTLLRILLCLVCEFHRQFSSLFDISRISLHCVYSFFSQDFTIQINTINFFLKFLFEFNLNLVCNDFCQVFCHSEINFFVLNFHFPDDYFDTVMYFGFNFGEVLLYLI